jgi:hypothetical protein
MVYNEGNMLRRWLAHYGRHLGARNLLVIDHGSDDGSTDDIGGAGRMILPRGPFDDGQRAEFVSGIQQNLLKYYDAVIYTDCDEFLVPDPRHFFDLRSYISAMKTGCIRAVGINVLHIRDREGPLLVNQGLLNQRGYCQFYSRESKPLIARTPLSWTVGFHACNIKSLIDPRLLLFHAKFADFDSALARLAVTREMQWSERALVSWGAHQRAGDDTMINGFEMHERHLREVGEVDALCPTAVANQTNAEIEASSNPLRCDSVSGPLRRVPEWLRDTV